jgi:predicted transcriptional regulator
MGKYRSRLEIIADILCVVNDNKGARKTRIMYQANLSYKLLTQYLNGVVEAGLVTFRTKNSYTLTQKGKEFLAKFGEYSKSCEKVEVQLNHVEDQRVMLEKMCPNAGAMNDNRSMRARVRERETAGNIIEKT